MFKISFIKNTVEGMNKPQICTKYLLNSYSIKIDQIMEKTIN